MVNGRNFGETALPANPAERSIRSMAELESYNTAAQIVDRVELLATNLEAQGTAILKIISDTCENSAGLWTQVYVFEAGARGAHQFAEQGSQNLLFAPINTAVCGISIMQNMVRFYPQFTSVMFAGYTPVEGDFSPLEQFGNPAVSDFSNRDEQLILYAVEQGQSYACQTYADLVDAARNVGRIT